MKKHILLLAAGAIVTLAACTNSNTNNGTMTQAQQDSAVNARAADSAAKMKAGNDSMINASAKMRADSTMRADSMMKAQTAKQQGTATANTGTKIVRQTTSTQHSSNTNSSNTKSNTTNPPNSTITKEQQNQQNNKFNER